MRFLVKKFLKLGLFLDSKINVLNLKFIAILSMFFAFLSMVVYIFGNYLFFYFCGPDRYGVGFHCGSIYYKKIFFLLSILIGCSLLLSVLIVIKKRQKHPKLLKFLTFLVFGTILLALLIWDNSSGFFSINFGPTILLIGFIFTAVFISSFSWSHLIKRNNFLVLPFIIINIFLIYNIELIQSSIPNKTYLQMINNCDKVLLEVGKNACIYSKAAKRSDPLICKDITDLSIKTQCSDYVYSNKARWTRDPKLCELVVVPETKKFCYEEEIRYWHGK